MIVALTDVKKKPKKNSVTKRKIVNKASVIHNKFHILHIT